MHISRRTLGISWFAMLIGLGTLLPLPPFWVSQLTYIAIYALTALGLVLLTGVGGLTSFGQAAFVGIGAYATAWITLNMGWSPLWALLIGLVLSCISSLIVGMITLRMSGHFLPLATIAWGLALYYLLGNVELLGKYDGLVGIPRFDFLGGAVANGTGLLALVWVLVLLCVIALQNLLDSRPGRAIRSLKSGKILAESMGINTLAYKVIIFVIAAQCATLSGCLLAHFQTTVNPSPFGLKMGIEYLFMVVLGGAQYLWGAIVGAAFIKYLDDYLQVLIPNVVGRSGSFEGIAFGIILILALKYMPNGIWHFAAMWLPKKKNLRELIGFSSDHEQSLTLPRRASIGAAPSATDAAVVLNVHGLRKAFGGLVAVDHIGFKIEKAQIVGLIGPNGAGKSTIFHCLTGILKKTQGTVHFLGRDISAASPRSIAKLGIARTFQHVKMVPDMTVLENVALGAHIRGQQGIAAAILHGKQNDNAAMLFEAKQQLTRIGMADDLFELAGNLPMGKQRLLELARALCLDPHLILLDEPAAGLRHREKQDLIRVLRQLQNEGMSILLVEHDMDLVMDICNHLVVMEFGRLLTQGRPAEVRNNPAVRAAYLGTEH